MRIVAVGCNGLFIKRQLFQEYGRRGYMSHFLGMSRRIAHRPCLGLPALSPLAHDVVLCQRDSRRQVVAEGNEQMLLATGQPLAEQIPQHGRCSGHETVSHSPHLIVVTEMAVARDDIVNEVLAELSRLTVSRHSRHRGFHASPHLTDERVGEAAVHKAVEQRSRTSHAGKQRVAALTLARHHEVAG